MPFSEDLLDQPVGQAANQATDNGDALDPSGAQDNEPSGESSELAALFQFRTNTIDALSVHEDVEPY